jgi:cell shape-determining protein MreC
MSDRIKLEELKSKVSNSQIASVGEIVELTERVIAERDSLLNENQKLRNKLETLKQDSVKL